VALRAARRNHTIFDALLLMSLMVLASLVLTASSSTAGAACEASYAPMLCSSGPAIELVRPS
jgi:hypothetical protein